MPEVRRIDQEKGQKPTPASSRPAIAATRTKAGFYLPQTTPG